MNYQALRFGPAPKIQTSEISSIISDRMRAIIDLEIGQNGECYKFLKPDLAKILGIKGESLVLSEIKKNIYVIYIGTNTLIKVRVDPKSQNISIVD